MPDVRCTGIADVVHPGQPEKRLRWRLSPGTHPEGRRSIRRSNLLHGKLYHINHNGIEKALVGSSNFTVSGLGYGAAPNIELNIEVTDDRNRLDLRNWFDELWNDEELVALPPGGGCRQLRTDRLARDQRCR